MALLDIYYHTAFDEKLLSWNKCIEVIQHILEKLTEKLNPSQYSGNNGELIRISGLLRVHALLQYSHFSKILRIFFMWLFSGYSYKQQIKIIVFAPLFDYVKLQLSLRPHSTFSCMHLMPVCLFRKCNQTNKFPWLRFVIPMFFLWEWFVYGLAFLSPSHFSFIVVVFSLMLSYDEM